MSFRLILDYFKHCEKCFSYFEQFSVISNDFRIWSLAFWIDKIDLNEKRRAPFFVQPFFQPLSFVKQEESIQITLERNIKITSIFNSGFHFRHPINYSSNKKNINFDLMFLRIGIMNGQVGGLELDSIHSKKCPACRVLDVLKRTKSRTFSTRQTIGK